MRILVIIPAYNEEATLVEVVKSIVLAGYDYVVVNDGSIDNTLQLCVENRFNFINLSNNLGIGGAVQAGHKYALQYDYDVDVQFDGDGQHNAEYIKVLLEEIESGADLVVGSRFISPCNTFRSTLLRRLGIKWLMFWLKLFTREKITDSTSGFRASSRKAMETFCAHYPSDYPEPESIAMALKKSLIVREVPVEMRMRQGGKSSIGGLSGIYYMLKVSIAISITALSRNIREK